MEQKQLNAAILGAYFGCEVLDTNTGESFEMVSVDNDRIVGSRQCSMYPDGDFIDEMEIKVSDTILVLRRLESLTDEEVVKVLEIDGQKAITPELDKKTVIRWNKYNALSRRTTDYLRSIKIDIGYGDIPSLIGAGLAIGKK